ncbi:alpha/beta hydrolase [Streptomyces flaveolus]|uniref:alpha/beta hydrolase n=1 Tax=Streptomyces flaveolus TaxID=67297 RepID=UPI0033FE15B1
MHHRKNVTAVRRLVRRCTLVTTAAALATAGVTLATAAPEHHNTPSAGRSSYSVGTVVYNLGDRAYELPGTAEPVELAATVHYPKNLNGAPRPLIVALHGWHETCADAAAETARDRAEQAQDWDAYGQASQRLFSWPCPPGVKPIANDRGYDYLGEQLAAQGFVVVSIRANGINASSVSGDENASTRADLINRHLALWQRLASTGTGQLAGHFRNIDTGRPVDVDFAHHVDMRDVGTLGHSRGGAGVTWQAAESHRPGWPVGVRVKAVFALAPAYNVMTEDMSAYRIDSTPLAVMRGTCDGQVGEEAFSFAQDATATGKADAYEFRMQGANHNYFNTQWSPQSGQVAAHDDAGHPQHQPGKCTDAYASTVDIQLTEEAQRQAGALYVGAYFRRYLMNDTRSAPVLEGRTHPAAGTATVDVKAAVRH